MLHGGFLQHTEICFDNIEKESFIMKGLNRKDIEARQKQHRDNPSAVFMMHLLMEQPCQMPSKKRMTDVLTNHIPSAECVEYHDSAAFYAVKDNALISGTGMTYPQLMLTPSIPAEDLNVDALTLGQMWDCPEKDRILEKCRYQVVVTDLNAAGMPGKIRAEMAMDFLEALMELYPSCKAVLFENSGKLVTRDKILGSSIPKEDRFIYYAVNIRTFNIRNSEDSLVDSLGMGVLGLPDLQYQFHGMETEEIVDHAYNVLSFLYENGNVIQEGDTIDGIVNGEPDSSVQWLCRYTEAHIRPERAVVEICTEV